MCFGSFKTPLANFNRINLRSHKTSNYVQAYLNVFIDIIKVLRDILAALVVISHRQMQKLGLRGTKYIRVYIYIYIYIYIISWL